MHSKNHITEWIWRADYFVPWFFCLYVSAYSDCNMIFVIKFFISQNNGNLRLVLSALQLHSNVWCALSDVTISLHTTHNTHHTPHTPHSTHTQHTTPHRSPHTRHLVARLMALCDSFYQLFKFICDTTSHSTQHTAHTTHSTPTRQTDGTLWLVLSALQIHSQYHITPDNTHRTLHSTHRTLDTC